MNFVSNATKGVFLTGFILNEFLPYQLAVLANRVSERFSQRYRDRFGITLHEWRVVAHLSQVEKISIREIYRQVEMDKSKASRAAARLEKAGYVTKNINPDDRRLVELSLTKKGHAMMDEIGPMGRDFQKEILEWLEPEERQKFLDSLNSMLEQCK